MREWLRETHGPGFELLRHFLLRFFDSDLVIARGQVAGVLIGATSILLPWFPVLAGPLRQKYVYFSKIAVPGPYREALRADELWLITLMMSAVGLLTAVKWQALFPTLRDYRTLGFLPLRSRQIFAAKLFALLIVTSAAVVALNLPPSAVFPVVSAGRWSLHPSLGGRMIIHAAACVAGCYFAFFGLVAAQGILLNLLRPPLFARVTGYLQGVVVALMLILIVLSFSIQAQVTNTVLQPGLARWVPPVWFLGFHQTMLGDPDPAMRVLAHRAAAGLITAVVLALLTYLLSYRRHRVLLIEGMTPAAKDRRWNSAILDWIIRDPRERAVMAFMAKTLSASSQHRTILMGYVGFGVAIVLSGVIGMQGLVESAKVLPACFVYTHVIVLVFLLIGLRHLFSLPIEFSANWTFQITEREGRIEWLYAMDRFVLVVGGALLLAVPFPIEVKLLGWRGVQESVLFAAFGLFCYECVFYSWQKLPFTCSHLPGKTPVWIVTLKLFALLWLLPVACWLLLACLYKALAFIIVVPALITAWIRVRASRRDGWYDLRLQYEEAPEPAVHALDLLK